MFAFTASTNGPDPVSIERSGDTTEILSHFRVVSQAASCSSEITQLYSAAATTSDRRLVISERSGMWYERTTRLTNAAFKTDTTTTTPAATYVANAPTSPRSAESARPSRIVRPPTRRPVWLAATARAARADTGFFW